MVNFVGKYLCYGDKESGFCVARIVGEGRVNTPEGPKEVFIVDERICGKVGSVYRIHGKTNFRVEKVNPKTDIFDYEPGMCTMTDEQLFLTMLNGRFEVVEGVTLGLANMMTALAGDGVTELAKKELAKRQVQEA